MISYPDLLMKLLIKKKNIPICYYYTNHTCIALLTQVKSNYHDGGYHQYKKSEENY